MVTEPREALALGQGANPSEVQVRSSHVRFMSTYPQKLCMSMTRSPEEPPQGLLTPWERKEGWKTPKQPAVGGE